MITITDALVSYLTGYTALTALVGQRIKPFHVPAGEDLPCVTYKRIDTPRQVRHDSSGASGDVINPRFQFDCWAKTEFEAEQISMVLQAALHMKKGWIGTSPNTKKVGLIQADGGGFSIFEPDVNVWRWMSQYLIGLVE
ncbi:MAG: hypothetical protein CVU43_04490 [Chloroflexi bacterium HGW-Chloroflexi-5]|jgi:hypothetical protein|nr:MAG: hypothetical protein CVU43_04490 [Chloroflexi bacterium HGW-Chloroflexi-5]